MNGLLTETARILQGQVHGEAQYTCVSTDTRTLAPGAVFVALRGPNFDGHQWVQAARDKGAVAAIVEHPVAVDFPHIVVPNTERALQQLAGAWRHRFDIPMVGITGSAGKTTTRALMASVLREAGCTHASVGSFNNEIGVPLTLLQLTAAHRYAVVEMGAGKPGDIALLTAIVKPTVAIITNIGPAHLEAFGTIDVTAATKAEIFEWLPTQGGAAMLNRDDQFFDYLWDKTAAHTRVTFGRHPEAMVRAVSETVDAGGRVTFQVDSLGETATITLPLLGKHNVMNALAVIAAARYLQIPWHQIVHGLSQTEAVHGRLRMVSGVAGACVIDDSYNANPASVRAAIEVLGARSGMRILVLGDMLALGADSARYHREMGQWARQQAISA